MDISYLLFLQSLRDATGGVFDSFMAYITTYGEELIGMMIAAGIYWCVDKDQGVYTMLTWGIGRLLNGFLKITFCVYRPWIRDSRIIPVDGAEKAATGYSFPSGHTTNATSVFGSIAMNAKLKKLLRYLMALMVLLVGFSRNYLGVHTPQDVVVGCGITVLLLLFVKWLLGEVEKKPELDTVVLIVGIGLAKCVMIYAAVKGYPMDYAADGKLIVDPARMAIETYKGCGFFMAALISWYVDRRWLKYRIEGNAMDRATCFVAGILGFLVIVYIIVPIFPNHIVWYVMDRFIRLIYVMLVVPFLIMKYRAAKRDI